MRSNHPSIDGLIELIRSEYVGSIVELGRQIDELDLILRFGEEIRAALASSDIGQSDDNS